MASIVLSPIKWDLLGSKISVVHVEKLDKAYWQNALTNNYSLLVGSGASIWQPSNLPNGQRVSKYLIEFLKAGSTFTAEQNDLVDQWIMGLPLEVLMSRCLDQKYIAQWLYEIYSKGHPNTVHDSLTFFASKSERPFIATTNYDTCLEVSAKMQGLDVTMIVRPTVKGKASPALPIMKVHGSAEKGLQSTMIYNVKQEKKLPEWKQKVLKGNIQGKALLIIGYSGLDFEICPFLSSFEPRVVMWNFLNEEDAYNSPGVKSFLRNKSSDLPVHFIIGDMRRIISDHFGSPFDVISCSLDNSEPSPISMSEPARKLWFARTLQALGIGRLAAEIFSEIESEDYTPIISKFEFYKYFGRAYGFWGEGDLAMKMYSTAVTHAPRRHKIDCTIALVNSAASMSNGSLSKLAIAMRHYKSAVKYLKHSNKNYKAQACLARVNIAKHYIKIYARDIRMLSKAERAIRVKRIRASRSFIKALLEEAVSLYYQTGDYSDLNACYLFARQCRVNLTVKHGLPPSSQGFQHLGYKTPEIIQFRNRLENAISLNDEQVAALKENIRITKCLGIGEYKKLVQIAERHSIIY